MAKNFDALCPFHRKPRQPGVSLESPVPENIPHKLESERSKSFVVSILLHSKDVGAQFRVPGTGKYSASSAHREFDQLRLDFPGLGGYFPVPGTLN